jgi:putative oxidoreductase
MKRFIPTNLSLALLLLRLTLAGAFLYHGFPKFAGHAAVVGFFTQAHIPAPELTAWLAAIVETGGGLLMLLGTATDVAGVLLAIEMLVAIAAVHWPKGFDFTNGGWEHPFTLLMMALAVALAGPGRYAVGAPPEA